MLKIGSVAALSLCLAIALLPAFTPGATMPTNGNVPITEDQTAADIVLAQPNLKIFVTLMTAADLFNPLQAEGSFTLFAPADAAFEKLPPGLLPSLLIPENKAKLIEIMTYHTLLEKMPISEIKPGKIKTQNGKTVDIKVHEGQVTINGAKLMKGDFVGSNGVVHIIDTVLLPWE